MINPRHALLVGGALYGCGALWMFQNYYKQSSFRKIFVSSDSAYENVKLMHHP